jgi:hypothetical protein
MNRFAPMLLPGLLLLSGCFRTHYRRPDLAGPPAYRGEAAGTAGRDAGLADLGWKDLIRDERVVERFRGVRPAAVEPTPELAGRALR